MEKNDIIDRFITRINNTRTGKYAVWIKNNGGIAMMQEVNDTCKLIKKVSRSQIEDAFDNPVKKQEKEFGNYAGRPKVLMQVTYKEHGLLIRTILMSEYDKTQEAIAVTYTDNYKF